MGIESELEEIDIDPEVAFRDIMTLLSTAAMGKEMKAGLESNVPNSELGASKLDHWSSTLGITFTHESINSYQGITFPLELLEMISSSYVFALQQIWGVDSTGVLEVLYSIYDEQPGVSPGEVLKALAATIAVIGVGIGTLGLGTPALVAFAVLAGIIGMSSVIYDASNGTADGGDVFLNGLASIVGILLALGPGVGVALASKLQLLSSAATSSQAQRILASAAALAANSSLQRAAALSGLAITSQDDYNDILAGIQALKEIHPSLSDAEAFQMLKELALTKQKLDDLAIPISPGDIQPIPAEPTAPAGLPRERERLENWLALHKNEPVLARYSMAASGFGMPADAGVVPPSIQHYLSNWGQLVGQSQHMGEELPFDPGSGNLTGSQILQLMKTFPDFDFTQQ